MPFLRFCLPGDSGVTTFGEEFQDYLVDAAGIQLLRGDIRSIEIRHEICSKIGFQQSASGQLRVRPGDGN